EQRLRPLPSRTGEAMFSFIAAAGAALIAALVLTRLVRRIALKLGILDYPDGGRKLHRAPVPLLGGVGGFAAWMVGLLAAWLAGTDSFGLQEKDDGFAAALFLSGGVVVVTGILDDRLKLRPRWKLLGQTVAAAILIAGGLIVTRVWLFGYTLD